MDILNFTILDYMFISGTHESKIFKHSKIAAITDLAILLGGKFLNFENTGNNYGCYCTTVNNKNYADLPYVTYLGNMNYRKDNKNSKEIGIRPVLSYSTVSEILPSSSINEILEIEFGEYPQQAVPSSLEKILEKMYIFEYVEELYKIYNIKNLKKTNKEYKIKYVEENNQFISVPEYEYNGKKYVRVEVTSSSQLDYNGEVKLSNKETYHRGDYVWLEVQPVKWLVDAKENFAITKNIIIAGIPINEKYLKYNFSKSILKKFMDIYFSEDIIPTKIESIQSEREKLEHNEEKDFGWVKVKKIGNM